MDSKPTADDRDPDITRPGLRTGRGAWSILPYLNQTLKARPRADLPVADDAQDGPPADKRDPQP